MNRKHAAPLLMRNRSRATVVCEELSLANTPFTRLFGLLGRSSLPAGHGLLIRPSSGVHTFGMRFPIDVVALDKHRRVSGIWPAVEPWRVCALSPRTYSVLELAAGEAARVGIELGDHLEVEPAGPSQDSPANP